MANADFWVELSEAEKDHHDACEAYWELSALARAERDGFGDAWVGADAQVASAYQAAEEAEGRLSALRALLSPEERLFA